MRCRLPAIALLLAVIATGCAKEMEAISQVTKFRVLGVQAEPPEISPGEGTELRVLYADPTSQGRDVTVLWLTCVGSFSPTSDISEGCEPIWLPQLSGAAEGGDVYTIPFTPGDLLAELPEEEEYLPVTAIVVLCAGGELSDFEKEPEGAIDGFDELCEGGDGLVAVKTFRVSDSDKPNLNPRIDRMLLEETVVPVIGADIDAGVADAGALDAGAPGKKDDEPAPGVFECEGVEDCYKGATIEAFLTPKSYQKYEKVEFGKTVKEEENPYISWFVTGGKFSDDRSRAAEPPGPFEVEWRPPKDGGGFKLWAVAHDLRGGTSWKTYWVSAITAD